MVGYYSPFPVSVPSSLRMGLADARQDDRFHDSITQLLARFEPANWPSRRMSPKQGKHIPIGMGKRIERYLVLLWVSIARAKFKILARATFGACKCRGW